MDLDRLAAHRASRAGRRGVETVDADLGRLVQRGQPGGVTRGHEVAGDLGLAIDQHPTPAGELAQVDAVPHPADRQFEAVVDQPLGMHAGADAGVVHQVGGALL